MTSQDIYNDPISYKMRSGNTDDPFVSIMQTDKVRNNIILLKEIPDKFNGISISDGTNNLSTIDSGIPDATKVVVDWTNGILTFADINDGKTYEISFYGKGNIYLPSSKVYLSTDVDGNVTETLQTLSNDMMANRDLAKTTNDEVQVAENTRLSNENTRQSQESARQTNTNDAINRLDNAVDSTKINWLSPVSLYSDIATTYPSPVNGDSVQVENDVANNGTYRFNGTTWIKIQNPNGYANSSDVKKTFIGTTSPTDDSVFWIDESVQ